MVTFKNLTTTILLVIMSINLASASRPVLLELFTSQGCSSCPPADKVIEELASSQSDTVFPVSFHVSYWNYLGWKDPFSLSENDTRQSIYARNFAKRSVYTPQAIVDGQYQTVGSQSALLSKLIDQAYQKQIDIPIQTKESSKYLEITLNKNKSIKNAELLMFFIDKKHTTKVTSGENHGKTLTNINVVRGIRKLSDWDGKALNIRIAKPKHNAILVLQEKNQGKVYGANQI